MADKKKNEPIQPAPQLNVPQNIQQFLKQQEKMREAAEKMKKEIESIKNKLKDYKKQIIKKYPYIEAIGLIPQQINKLIEEELLTEEELKQIGQEKVIHLIVLIPEEKIKEVGKLKLESIKLTEKIKPKIWFNFKTINDLWEMCFDSKYQLIEAISMAFPIYDKGLLGSLRVANVHKNMVLHKFEKYVVSYVIAGSLVRGQATKTSDVDVYLIIDDTDVKRMSRFELKEKLRAIIYSYVIEAGEIAGVKNKLNVQVYILTEFWEAVKDAHPVIFTFIRDGVPLYDRGAFTPWKLLLKMGKIKPSPEAIEMFMSLGDRVVKTVKSKLNDIVTGDIYWGIITPSQAVLMLYGIAPPTPKETIQLMKKIFVQKEKLLEQKYVNILEKIVDIYKKYEHEKIKEIKGQEIDVLLKESQEYMDRLKKLMEQIEEKTNQTVLNEIYDEVFSLLKKVFGNYSNAVLEKKLETELVNKGKIQKKHLRALKELVKAKKIKKKTKLTKHEIARIRKDSLELIQSLIDYMQRKDFLLLEEKKIKLLYKEKREKEAPKEADLYIFDDYAYIVEDVTSKTVKRIDIKNGTKSEISSEKFVEILEKNKNKRIKKKVSIALINTLREIYGEFELIF